MLARDHAVRTEWIRADWLVLAAAVLVVLTVAVWLSGVQTRAIRRIEPESREQLYARTIENLSWCRAHGDTLPAFCEREARFALSFPECDADCRALAEHWVLPHR